MDDPVMYPPRFFTLFLLPLFVALFAISLGSGMPLGEAARMLEWVLPSGDTDRKKVARHVERGLDQMRVWLTSAPWIRALVGELLPQES